jgi:hypothetical protein
MTPRQFKVEIMLPGLHVLHGVGGPPIRDAALQMLLTIALQESAIEHRAQVIASGNPGPARGWWQFERAGGVAGVMSHPASAGLARALCAASHVPFRPHDIWRCLEGHDTLAVGFARLLLWTDPLPLPTDHASGWSYYLNNWRPGKPHPAKWPGYWRQAGEALQ